jgi:hypothetical protein
MRVLEGFTARSSKAADLPAPPKNWYNKKVKAFIKDTIGAPAQWLITAAAEIGLNVSAFVHEITNQFKNHVINRHGDPALHGAATVTDADFYRIPGIIQAPDMAIIGAKRKQETYIVYAKTAPNMTYLYFEQVLYSRKNKALRGSTFYKVTRALTLDEVLKTVSRNEKTDISGAKIYLAGKQ